VLGERALTRVAADKTARDIGAGWSLVRAVLQQNPVSLEHTSDFPITVRLPRLEWLILTLLTFQIRCLSKIRSHSPSAG
jgi:hypothetical protein